MLFINGWHTVPLGPSWAVLLRTFLTELTQRAREDVELQDCEIKAILNAVTEKMARIYPSVSRERFTRDLDEIIAIVIAIARGEQMPAAMKSTMTLADYAPQMTAPHRMDLIVAPMTRNGVWACPLHCRNCYAAGQPAMKNVRELSTFEWKDVIDRCRTIGIPQLSFTGGEPLTRPDIVELVDHARWHVTRLNTSGVNLSPGLANELKAASLDAIQITLYSDRADIHDKLVGKEGAWAKTIEAISHAVRAGLCVSVNTPLTRANADYASMLHVLYSMGITFVSCSGLIWAGAAQANMGNGESLTSDELYAVLQKAMVTATNLGMEVSFTSPGWLNSEHLRKLGLATPICGACLSNMAIAPDGSVVPCQSWLNGQGLGNILNMPWRHIWNSPACKRIRKQAALKPDCPLKEEVVR